MFDNVQRRSIQLFKQEFDCMLDPGELESAAVANELRIKHFVSDDNNAKKVIQHEAGLEVIGLSYWEVLIWAVENTIVDFDDAKRVFTEVNATRDRPIGKTFEELREQTIKRFQGITW